MVCSVSESEESTEQHQLVINNSGRTLGAICFSERVLQAEDLVSVYGAGSQEPDPEGAMSYRLASDEWQSG